MTNVYFVRHAQPDYQVHDDMLRPLTKKGLRDCALVSEYLSGRNISRVYSSQYKRAVDTVRGFAETCGLDIVRVEAFRERRIAGGWIEDFASYAKKQWADFDFALPGGESLRQVQVRNIAALNDLLAAHPGENIAVGSHGTALSTIMNYYDKSFDFNSFQKIVGLMPWIVHFTFDGKTCAGIECVDPLKRPSPA
jgi:2,3-bisphosphoglycerate-dependent phosphoglycerate mutase